MHDERAEVDSSSRCGVAMASCPRRARRRCRSDRGGEVGPATSDTLTRRSRTSASAARTMSRRRSIVTTPRGRRHLPRPRLYGSRIEAASGVRPSRISTRRALRTGTMMPMRRHSQRACHGSRPSTRGFSARLATACGDRHLLASRDPHRRAARIADAALRNIAPVLDARLSGARYQTILHGDPKEANFCFSEDGPSRRRR